MILIRILLLWLLLGLSYSHYYPQLNISYQGGSSYLGRASALIPVLQNSNNLLFVNVIGMLTSKKHQEYNFGLGYRWLTNLYTPSIIGVYGYYDYRIDNPKSKIKYVGAENTLGKQLGKKTYQQAVIGVEWLTEQMELRTNVYIPLFTHRYTLLSIKDIYTDGTEIYFGDVSEYARSLGGVDAECGIRVLDLPLQLFVGGYYFADATSAAITGPRVRLEFYRWNWLKLSGEYSYDKERKHTYYGAVTLEFRLGQSFNDSAFSLTSKMTQQPVRDRDIVVQDSYNLSDFTKATQVTTVEQFKEALDAKSRVIVIMDDLDFQNQDVALGKVTGIKIMGVNALKNNGIFSKVQFADKTLSNYHINVTIEKEPPVNLPPEIYKNAGRDLIIDTESDSNIKVLFNGLFDYMDNCEIGYLAIKPSSNMRFDGMTMYGKKIYFVAGLVGTANNSDIHNIKVLDYPNFDGMALASADLGNFDRAFYSYNGIISGISVGLVGLATGNTTIHNCNNSISGEKYNLFSHNRHIAGFVGVASDNTRIFQNIISSIEPITAIVNDFQYITHNYIDSFRRNIAGIVWQAYNDVLIENNINNLKISNADSGIRAYAGIVLHIHDGVQVINNTCTTNKYASTDRDGFRGDIRYFSGIVGKVYYPDVTDDTKLIKVPKVSNNIFKGILTNNNDNINGAAIVFSVVRGSYKYNYYFSANLPLNYKEHVMESEPGSELAKQILPGIYTNIASSVDVNGYYTYTNQNNQTVRVPGYFIRYPAKIDNKYITFP